MREHPALTLLAELLAAPSPSGREAELAELVRGKLDGLGYPHETDAAGNVLVRLDGRPYGEPSVILRNVSLSSASNSISS